MDNSRLKAIVGQVEKRDVRDATELELSYCMSRGWVLNVEINGRLQAELTDKGKSVLMMTCRWSG